jgi:glycosidase
MQWLDADYAGFSVTSGTAENPITKPWLKVNPNYTHINVAKQDKDSGSVLNFYRKLLKWRKYTPAMHLGAYQDLLPGHPSLWVYERTLAGTRFVIAANFSSEIIALPPVSSGNFHLSNYSQPLPQSLQAFEARIYREVVSE